MASAAAQKIRGVVFDLAGTLIHPARPVADTYYEFGRDFGSALSREEISLRFRKAFATANWSDASHASQRETWRNIVYGVFHMPAARGELFEALWSYFAKSDAWQLFDDVTPAVAALRKRQVAIAIGSNFDDRVQPICDQLGLSDLVDEVFWSSRLGCAKPAQRFFISVAERMKSDPSRLLMVGDRTDHDVHAAQQAGWQALHLVRGAEQTPASDAIADLCEVANRI